jgi:hypothetical protein
MGNEDELTGRFSSSCCCYLDAPSLFSRGYEMRVSRVVVFLFLALFVIGCSGPTGTRQEALGLDGLCNAIQRGDVQEVQRQLEMGVDPNEVGRVSGAAALHHAALTGQEEAIRILVAHGADLNLRTRVGLTPLHTAIYAKEPGAASVLIELGADLTIRDDDGGGTPLQYARTFKQPEIERMLIEAGARE